MFATVQELITHAKKLRGRTLRQVLDEVPPVLENPSSARNKGAFGQSIEHYFDIKTNSEQRPDFENLGVELKVIPLTRRKRELAVKERTKVTSISYPELRDVPWRESHAYIKTSKILFVFYLWEPEMALADLKIHSIMLYEPSPADAAQFKRDYETLQEKTRRGQAHKISESDTYFLGACTSGTGRLVDQPNNEVKAKTRSFSLKPTFTTELLREAMRSNRSESELLELASREGNDLIKATLKLIEAHIGEDMLQLAKSFRYSTKSKSWKALTIRKLLGSDNPRFEIKELKKRVITIKTLPVHSTKLKPFEAMSFPKFDHMKLPEQTEWESSELKEQLTHLILVPLLSSNKKGPFKIGTPFAISLTAEEDATAEDEWQNYRDLIATGKADQLPRESSTTIIHVRPHAQNKNDTEPAPGGLQVTKKCFWLNKALLAKKIQANQE